MSPQVFSGEMTVSAGRLGAMDTHQPVTGRQQPDGGDAVVGATQNQPDNGRSEAGPTTSADTRARYFQPANPPPAEPKKVSLVRQKSPLDAPTTAWLRPGTGPIQLPGDPRHKWRRIAKRTLSKAWADSLFGMSAEAAFWQVLSTVPLLLALLGSIGFVANWFGPDTVNLLQERIVTVMRTVFSPDVSRDLIEPTVDTILHRGQADVVSVGFVISLWAGSSAIAAFVESITVAYGQHEERHPVKERFFALALYLMALVFGVFALPMLALGPEYLPQLFPVDWRNQVSDIVDIAYYPGIGLLLVLALATLYKVAPPRKHPWRRGLPGAVLAAAFFLIASAGLRIYIGYVTTHGLTYGALAAPIAFLLFAYFVGLAIIIGAQFNNATLEVYPPRRSKRERRKWQRLDAGA